MRAMNYKLIAVFRKSRNTFIYSSYLFSWYLGIVRVREKSNFSHKYNLHLDHTNSCAFVSVSVRLEGNQ